MRKYLNTDRSILAALLFVGMMMTGYEAIAMKSLRQADPQALPACMATTSAAKVAEDKAATDNKIAGNKVASKEGPKVYATRRFSPRRTHVTRRLSGQQDFDFGYPFDGSNLN